MKKFWLDCLIGSAFVFAVLFGLYGITQLRVFDAFDPIGQALSDMEFTDIAFSQLRDDPPMDTNVVIVNIGYLSRPEIGQQILNLSQYKPKVVALDIIYSCDWFQDSTICPQAYDTIGNKYFADAVRQAKNVVMVSRLDQTRKLKAQYDDIDLYDSIEHTYPTLMPGAYEGYANLETEAAHQEDLKACRRFNPQMMVNGTRELAFSVQIAMLYDSIKTERFLARDNYLEVINYKGNIVDWHGASNYAGRYIVLDWDQALDTTQFVGGMIKDKIVIMGFLGGDLTDTSWDDKFFTPLNKKYAGKARPDMYGVVVHANIVSMILEEDYIEVLPSWLEIAIAIVVCLLNVALFLIIMQRIPDWFDGISVAVQLFQIVLFSFLMIEFFNWFNFKINITWSLAVVAVVGTSFELYNGVLKTLFNKVKSRWFTSRRNESI
ncbi:CHASE2 domain-containing protein [Oscillatoria amoena NRMC-F 0135]|nr:CHASE2 domain-containing protein [Oscillatoria amoena NRMC-F 0135]